MSALREEIHQVLESGGKRKGNVRIKWRYKIWVGGLPHDTNEDDVGESFLLAYSTDEILPTRLA